MARKPGPESQRQIQEFAERFRRLLRGGMRNATKGRPWTNAELAEVVGVSDRTISSWVNGKSKPSLKALHGSDVNAASGALTGLRSSYAHVQLASGDRLSSLDSELRASVLYDLQRCVLFTPIDDGLLFVSMSVNIGRISNYIADVEHLVGRFSYTGVQTRLSLRPWLTRSWVLVSTKLCSHLGVFSSVRWHR
jgi:hypothetical protein